MANDNQSNSAPGWVWLFTGTALGAFIMFLTRLSEIETSQPSPKAISTQNQPQSSQETTQQKPRFDFYNVLKENRVSIPKAQPLPHTKPTEDNASYILQVASFKSAADAEELKVKLILLNLESRSEQVTVRNGEVWHRVLVGPFDSR